MRLIILNGKVFAQKQNFLLKVVKMWSDFRDSHFPALGNTTKRHYVILKLLWKLDKYLKQPAYHMEEFLLCSRPVVRDLSGGNIPFS